MRRYEVSYAVNTVDGKTVTLNVTAAGYEFTETYLFFRDDENQTVLAIPLSREPIVMAVVA